MSVPNQQPRERQCFANRIDTHHDERVYLVPVVPSCQARKAVVRSKICLPIVKLVAAECLEDLVRYRGVDQESEKKYRSLMLVSHLAHCRLGTAVSHFSDKVTPRQDDEREKRRHGGENKMAVKVIADQARVRKHKVQVQVYRVYLGDKGLVELRV